LAKSTGKHLVVEGVSYLAPDEVRIAAEGSKALIERAGLPVSEGTELELTILEEHAYNHRDGIARLDGGYVVSVSGAAGLVGQRVRVRVESADRDCAHGRVLTQ
jgi:predicted RNA-binding protein with TRAM domain